MNVRNTDFQLSGVSDTPFEACFSSLKRMDEQYHLWRLVIWDLRGQPDTTICDEGTSIADADAILEYDFTQIREYSAEFDVVPTTRPCAVSAIRGRHAVTGLSGFLPFTDALGHGATQAQIASTLAGYADFCLSVAVASKSKILSVADDWCEDGLGPYEIAPPSLLCVIQAPLVRGVIADLRNAGAVIDREIHGLVRVWLQSPDLYILGHEPNRLVHDLLSKVLSLSE